MIPIGTKIHHYPHILMVETTMIEDIQVIEETGQTEDLLDILDLQ